MKPSIVNINTHGLVFSEWGYDKAQVGLTTLVQPLAEQKLACRLVVVPAGNLCNPYHFQFANEEIYVILEGEGTLRHGTREYPIRPGDVISTPPEPAARQFITNTGKTELRYLAICNVEQPDEMPIPEQLQVAEPVSAEVAIESVEASEPEAAPAPVDAAATEASLPASPDDSTTLS